MPVAFRAETILTLAGETPARTPAALDAPFDVVRDGVLVAEHGRVVDVLPYAAFASRYSGLEPVDFGKACLAPGFVNAHCHLELSHLSGKTASGLGFGGWMQSLVPLVAEPADGPTVEKAVRNAFEQVVASGTAHVGDIGSRRPDIVACEAERAMRVSGAAGYPVTHFLEVLGYDLPEGDKTDACALAPAADLLPPEKREHGVVSGHALYTTAPGDLRAAHAWCRARNRTFSIHLAESAEEEECLTAGTGLLYGLLRVRMLPDGWRAPAMRPVPYADSLGLLDANTMAVHCVRCNEEDIALLAARGCFVCLCPRSNDYIGTGAAPAMKLAEAGVVLCLGTDGLSSNTDLDMRRELLAAQSVYGFSPRAALRMASLHGAHALKLDHLGTLEPGKSAAFVVLEPEWTEGLL